MRENPEGKAARDHGTVPSRLELLGHAIGRTRDVVLLAVIAVLLVALTLFMRAVPVRQPSHDPGKRRASGRTTGAFEGRNVPARQGIARRRCERALAQVASAPGGSVATRGRQ
ncbi:MAG: hypothetical protein H0V16_07270 [Burkholderiaceae bacterium]|nr:hypothetical protein [Burkholderiaceae bacterium]